MIGARMRQARLASGLSLAQVAERLGGTITRAGLSKYELGKSTPGADFLSRLAHVLGVKASYFLQEHSVEVRWLAYRSHARLGARDRGKIQAFAVKQIEGQMWLRSLLHEDERPRFPSLTRVISPQDAEAAADRLRRSWGLGDLPIESMTSLVEDRGGLVLGWPEDGRFDSLAGWVNERIPVILVNLRAPDDRRRYDIAHEVGHIVMKSEPGKGAAEEAVAHRFAAAFLVPAQAAVRELGRRRRSLDLQELGLLKRKYGFSMQAWIRRARDLEIVGEGHYRQLNVLFRSRGWHRVEPFPYHGDETPRRCLQMARHALAESLVTRDSIDAACPGLVCEGEGVEAYVSPEFEAVRLARCTPEERFAALSAAADAAADVYAADDELTAFTELDSEEFHRYEKG